MKIIAVLLTHDEKPSKLSRLILRNTVCGTVEDLEKAQKQLAIEISAAWDLKWSQKI